MNTPKPEIDIIIDGIKYKANFRTFKSGKQGYGSYGKIYIGGNQFQLSCNIIKL